MFMRLIDGAAGYIVTLNFKLNPVGSDVILPPFSSKVMKSILYTDPALSPIKSMYESQGSFKPVTIRALRRGERRLFSNGSSFLVARADEELRGSIVAFFKEVPDLPALSGAPQGEIRLGSARIIYEMDSALIERVSDISVGLSGSDRFWLRAHTPVLISTKTMTPPSEKVRELSRRLPKAQRLIITPAYLCAEAARPWIAMVLGAKADSPAPYYLGRICDLMLAEFDFRLRAATALYDVRGERVMARGPVGSVGFMLLSRRIVRVLDKILAFAVRMGLGKSRSIGFGEISVMTASGAARREASEAAMSPDSGSSSAS